MLSSTPSLHRATLATVVTLSLLAGSCARNSIAPDTSISTDAPALDAKLGDSRPHEDAAVEDAPTVAPGTSWLIKVLAFNIHALPTVADAGQYRAIGEILAERRQLGDEPDVVLLQESFLPEADILRQLAGYPHELLGPAKDEKLLSSGLVVMSNHPILSSRERAYEACAIEDCLANKGVVAVEIQPPGMPLPLLLLTTHLQAQGEWDEVRRQQTDQVVDFLDELGYDARASIFAGDFNIKPARESYGYWLDKTPYLDAGRFCLDNPTVCTIELADDGFADEGDVWEGTNDRHFFFGPEGKDGSRSYEVEPVYLTRNFTALYNGTDHYSDHWGYEVHYRLTWR